MFRLIVMLAMVTNVNGVVEVTPAGQFKNKMKFETEKSCMEFITSNAGEKSRLLIEEMIDQKPGLTATYSCIQDGALREDDSI